MVAARDRACSIYSAAGPGVEYWYRYRTIVRPYTNIRPYAYTDSTDITRPNRRCKARGQKTSDKDFTSCSLHAFHCSDTLVHVLIRREIDWSETSIRIDALPPAARETSSSSVAL